jgi:nucleotide-binding universal stress UspA family protein
MAQQAQAEAKLAAQAASFPGANVKVVWGQVTQAICNEAVNGAYDLVVMGTKGATGLREWLSGSETQHVVRKCPVPVLSMMCDRSDSPLQHLLLVGEFNDSEKHPLAAIRAIQAAFGSTLHLLRILQAGDKPEAVRAQVKAFAKAHSLENPQVHLHRDSGIEAGVVHFNQMHDMDLVCIGTHARTGIGAWLRGSVAESLVNHLYKPMITYHLN